MDNYEYFIKQVYKLTNIDLSLYKEKQMKRRIKSLLSRNGFKDFAEYFNGIKNDRKLFEEFINYLTINVSEFFRNPNQWEVLEKEILPYLINRHGKIRIWSAACSTGEEPYSLAMLLTKFYPITEIKIFATDIDKAAIEKAKMGIYSEKSIENVPLEFKNKYFTKLGNSYKIDESIKRCVEFSQHNLLKDIYPSNNHLILCRNVMIYFTEEAKVEMYKKFHNALTADGILFVGSTEQIILPERYNFKAFRTFFYSKI